MISPVIKLKILTPRKAVLSKDIDSISLPTPDGEITVLPHHANLFTLLTEGIIKINAKGDQDYLAIGGGYAETDGQEIHVLVSKAYGQKEVDEALTQKAVLDAQKILKTTRSEKERQEAASILKRSLIDIRLLKRKRRATLSG